MGTLATVAVWLQGDVGGGRRPAEAADLQQSGPPAGTTAQRRPACAGRGKTHTLLFTLKQRCEPHIAHVASTTLMEGTIMDLYSDYRSCSVFSGKLHSFQAFET